MSLAGGIVAAFSSRAFTQASRRAFVRRARPSAGVMVEVNESLAGDPRAVPPEVYNWAADQVFKLSREQGAQPEGFWENAAAFGAAVDWSETWIQGLIAFHVLAWVFVLIFRKNMTFQSAVFLTLCVLVRGAEFINTKLREQYWVRFSKQNYFDERGVFAVVMFTGPLICLALVQLFIFLFATADMLVQVKKAELREKHKEKKKQQ